MAHMSFNFQRQFLDIIKNAASQEAVYKISKEAKNYEQFNALVRSLIDKEHMWTPPCRSNGKRGGTPDYMGFDDEMKQVIKSKRVSKGKKTKKSKPTDSFKKAFGPRALGRGLSKQKTKIPGFQVQSKTKSGAILVPPIDYEKIAECLKAEKPLSLETITLTGEAKKSWPLKKANLDDEGNTSVVPIGYWASLSPVDESNFDTQSLRSKATDKYIPIKQLTDAQAYCFNFELEKDDDGADVLAQLAEKEPVVKKQEPVVEEHKVEPVVEEHKEEPVVKKVSNSTAVEFAEGTKSHDGKLATTEQIVEAIKLFCKEEFDEESFDDAVAIYIKKYKKYAAKKMTIAEMFERNKSFAKIRPFLEKIKSEVEDSDDEDFPILHSDDEESNDTQRVIFKESDSIVSITQQFV